MRKRGLNCSPSGEQRGFRNGISIGSSAARLRDKLPIDFCCSSRSANGVSH
ncbi:hypothetical protein V3C99_019023 [Haemonchus contortus]|uniref:Uncharacterized protein n=1 Tax=Haemonchus contortus TaxID=6289 RepID=A0A7I4YZ13_HAECO